MELESDRRQTRRLSGGAPGVRWRWRVGAPLVRDLGSVSGLNRADVRDFDTYVSKIARVAGRSGRGGPA